MTIETRTTIQIPDIKSIEFECNKCHTKTAYTVDQYKFPLTRCTTCDDSEQWLIAGGTEWEDLKRLGDVVRRFSKPNGKFSVRLEITTPSASRVEVGTV